MEDLVRKILKTDYFRSSIFLKKKGGKTPVRVDFGPGMEQYI